MKKALFSVVLPVHNQADHIGQVIGDFEAWLGMLKIQHELVLVVNASRDHSASVCRALARRNPRLRVLESRLGGWGRAVKMGIRSSRGSILCYTNSSRTSPMELASMLLAASMDGSRALKADRRLRGNPLRKIGSFIYNLECRLLFGFRTRDVNGTPKVFPRKFSKLLELSSDGDLIDAEFNACCQREGYPLLELPVFAHRRHGGKSTTNFRSALGMYLGAFRLWRSMKKGA